jgi:uncharacterized protein
LLKAGDFMRNFFSSSQWDWKKSGVALGAVFLLAVFLVKPIGVSTQFVIFDGIVWRVFSKNLVVKNKKAKFGYSSSNAYLNKRGGKYAKNVAHPLSYSYIFVLAMILGGFLSSFFRKKEMNLRDIISTKIWPNKTCDSINKRYLCAFFGGFLTLFGARLAGGCTSGHMMSGIMQTSLSGYLFAGGAFLVAIPFAMLFYKKRGE